MRGAHSSLISRLASQQVRHLLLSVCLAHSSFAFAQGFGGDESKEECVIIVEGQTISCDERPAAKPKAEASASNEALSAKPTPRSKKGDVSPNISDDNKFRTNDEHIRPFGKRLGPAPEVLEDVLGDFKQELKAREKELEDLLARPIYKRKERERLDHLREQIKREKEVVTFLSGRARAQVVSCARTSDPAWFKRYGKPKGYTMTPGGALPRAPEIAADPAGCESQRFVSKALLEDSLRYFSLKHFLKHKRWGYGQKREREKYEEEFRALDDKLNFTNKLRVLKYDKNAASKLYEVTDPKTLYQKKRDD